MTLELRPDVVLGEHSRISLPGMRGRKRVRGKLAEVHPTADRTDGRPTICIDRAGFRRADHSPDKDGRCVFCS